MVVRFLVYFFLVLQASLGFTATTPIMLRVEDGAYFEPFLYRISSKGGGVLFLLGIEHLDYPLNSFHPMIYKLMMNSDALLFEHSTQDYIDSLSKYRAEYEALGINVSQKIQQALKEIYKGESESPTFESQIKLIIQKTLPQMPMFGLDDPETLLNICKVVINSFIGIPTTDKENIRHLELFIRGDSKGLYDSEYNPRDIGKEGGPTQEQVSEVLENNKFILDKRNQIWYEKIKELMRLPNMKEATFFGMVGVYHLLEENNLSLPNIFKYKGYRVQRITNNYLDYLDEQLK